MVGDSKRYEPEVQNIISLARPAEMVVAETLGSLVSLIRERDFDEDKRKQLLLMAGGLALAQGTILNYINCLPEKGSTPDRTIILDGQKLSANILGISRRGKEVLDFLPALDGRPITLDNLRAVDYLSDEERMTAKNILSKGLGSLKNALNADREPLIVPRGSNINSQHVITRDFEVDGRLVEATRITTIKFANKDREIDAASIGLGIREIELAEFLHHFSGGVLKRGICVKLGYAKDLKLQSRYAAYTHSAPNLRDSFEAAAGRPIIDVSGGGHNLGYIFLEDFEVNGILVKKTPEEKLKRNPIARRPRPRKAHQERQPIDQKNQPAEPEPKKVADITGTFERPLKVAWIYPSRETQIERWMEAAAAHTYPIDTLDKEPIKPVIKQFLEESAKKKKKHNEQEVPLNVRMILSFFSGIADKSIARLKHTYGMAELSYEEALEAFPGGMNVEAIRLLVNNNLTPNDVTRMIANVLNNSNDPRAAEYLELFNEITH